MGVSRRQAPLNAGLLPRFQSTRFRSMRTYNYTCSRYLYRRGNIPRQMYIQSTISFDSCMWSCKMVVIKYTFVALFLVVILPFGMSTSHCPSGGTDMTLMPRATGEAVVLDTINKIEESMVFREVFNFDFLRRMAAVETNDGMSASWGRGGIWGIRTRVFNDVDMFMQSGRGMNLEEQIKRELCFDWSSEVNNIERLDIPLYSALVVMIRLESANNVDIPNDIRGQADIWKNVFNNQGNIELFIEIAESLSDEECEIVGVELVFVMDESGSIMEENFELMKEFAINVTDTFEIAPGRTQVGWISFGTEARVIFDLNNASINDDKASLHNAILSAPYSDSRTNLGDGLLLLNDVFSSSDEKYLPKIVIVVTDGRSNEGNTSVAVTMLRNDINIFVVGVGNAFFPELELVASAGTATDPLEHVYFIENFIEKDLDTLQKTIRARACFDAMFSSHTASIDRLNRANEPIPDGIVHFNLDCPLDGLTINACGREGKTFLYISYDPNPNSASYDEILEIVAGRCLNTFIPCRNNNGRRKRQAPEKIYVAIEGKEEHNVYDVEARTGDHSTPQIHLRCMKEVTDDQEGFVVHCTSESTLTSVQCSINNEPLENCMLPLRVNFTPPLRDYSIAFNVTSGNLTDFLTVTHQVAPLGFVCSLNSALEVDCSSSNILSEIVCTFNGDPCVLPFKIDVKGLTVGSHPVIVKATDLFGFTAEAFLDYIVVEDRVGDDMVMRVVLDIRPTEVGVSKPTVSLCYQVHGQEERFYNLISDVCVSVNAHISQPYPDINSHVMDKIGIRAVGSNRTCYNIMIERTNCAVTINNHPLLINSHFEEENIIIFNDKQIDSKPNVIHVSVPNCGRPLVDTMHITCTDYHIRHSSQPTDVLEFTTTRGLSPIDAAHGLIGQFWGRFMLGRSLPEDQHSLNNDKMMSVYDGRTPNSFPGFIEGSWDSYHEQCFFAGDRQGYRVIEGQYGCYEVDEIFSTQFSTRCSIECSKVVRPNVKCSKRFSTECSKDCPHSKFEDDKCVPQSGSGLGPLFASSYRG